MRENGDKMEHLLLGAGCFWSAEHKLKKLAHVRKTEVGFAKFERDQNIDNGLDKEVIEVVKLWFDEENSIAEIIDYFWLIHDPTIEHQGLYRSAIMCTSPEMIKRIEGIKEKKQKAMSPKEIKTKIGMYKVYKKAPEKDQGYLN